jgi:hypothetical protein
MADVTVGEIELFLPWLRQRTFALMSDDADDLQQG